MAIGSTTTRHPSATAAWRDAARALIDPVMGLIGPLRRTSTGLRFTARQSFKRRMRLEAPAARVAINAASVAIRVLGGYDCYMRGYEQERRLRDIATLALEPLDPTRSLLWADALMPSAEIREP